MREIQRLGFFYTTKGEKRKLDEMGKNEQRMKKGKMTGRRIGIGKGREYVGKNTLLIYFNSMFYYTSSSENRSPGKEGSNCAPRTAVEDSQYLLSEREEPTGTFIFPVTPGECRVYHR